ncbi:MAG: hypothetical protein K5776_07620 [Lachnospiraceae bacterium]|nr:hypothetical protein [Lachnospiraceae bacterium]
MKFRLMAVLIIGGIALTLFGGRGIFVMMTPAVDLYAEDCNWENLHANQRVETNIDFVLDHFYAFKDDASELYMFPDLKFYDDGAQIEHYMAVVVSQSDYEQFDRLVEDSWAWWDGESDTLAAGGTIPRSGYLRKMNKDEREELTKILKDYDYTDEMIEKVVVPYVFMKSQTPISNIISLAGGLLMLVAGIAFLVFGIIRRK